MKLIFLSVYNKTLDTLSSSNGTHSVEIIHSEYEFTCPEYNLRIALKVFKGEKLLDKLKEILKEDFEIEMPDATIK